LSQAIGFWSNQGILFTLDPINAIAGCDPNAYPNGCASLPDMDLTTFWIYDSNNSRSSFTPSWVEAYRRLCGEPGVTQSAPISYCLPNGSQLLLAASIGIQNEDFGATAMMPLGPSGSWLPINLSAISDLSNGMTIAHELGHQLLLPHCSSTATSHYGIPPGPYQAPSLTYCGTGDLMNPEALGQPPSDSGLTPLQIRRAQATARKLAGIKQ
jgi:hypothetical protein